MTLISKRPLRVAGKARIAITLAALVALAGCSVFGGDGKGKPRTPVLGQRVSILSSETGIAVDPALADVAVLLPPALPNDSWTQPGGNGSKAMEHPALGTALGVAWSTSVTGSSKQVRLAAAPVVGGGRVYVMDTDAGVHAIDAKTGRQVWKIDFGTSGDGKSSVFGGGVSVDGDTLYVTNGLGDIAALKASNGAVVWKKRPGGPLRGAPSFGLGNVYAMTQDNQIFALKASDGSTEWTESGASELAGVFGVAAPAIAQGTIVAGFSSGELNAYRYENGRVLWGDALTRTSTTTSVSALGRY